MLLCAAFGNSNVKLTAAAQWKACVIPGSCTIRAKFIGDKPAECIVTSPSTTSINESFSSSGKKSKIGLLSKLFNLDSAEKFPFFRHIIIIFPSVSVSLCTIKSLRSAEPTKPVAPVKITVLL
mmetsp:Transcript_14280/g.39844  ORF Transcript_14280/g.39844 Transcript_14280/m.39844 type:complete len:123 (-) Transcript_14280:1175-1543(-)